MGLARTSGEILIFSYMYVCRNYFLRSIYVENNLCSQVTTKFGYNQVTMVTGYKTWSNLAFANTGLSWDQTLEHYGFMRPENF